MNEKEIKVTGTRVFETGAHRDPNDDKGRYDLLSPMFIKRLAVHTQKGGKARGDRNWEAGMPMDAVLDSAIRHLFNYLEGDRSEDHLAAAAWNVMNLIHTEEQIERGNLPKKLADGLPDYTEKPSVSSKEIMQRLLTYGQYPFKLIPVEDIHPNDYCMECGLADYQHFPKCPNKTDYDISEYVEDKMAGPYDGTGKPYEHWDCVPSAQVAEFKELERCCQNCIHRSPLGGPVPLSQRCTDCIRLSEWSSTTEPTLGPDDISGEGC